MSPPDESSFPRPWAAAVIGAAAGLAVPPLLGGAVGLLFGIPTMDTPSPAPPPWPWAPFCSR